MVTINFSVAANNRMLAQMMSARLEILVLYNTDTNGVMKRIE